MTKSYEIKFTKNAEKEYKKLKKNEQALSKIKSLLESISQTPDYGIGHPERLKGYGEKLIYSRHINEKDRLTYEILKNSSGEISFIHILAFIGHYDDR
jgi:toxin YoeB